MDLAAIIGLIAVLAVTIGANVMAGGSPAQLVSSPIPIMLCVLGSFLVSMMQYPLKMSIGIHKLFMKAFRAEKEDAAHAIEELVAMSDKARREGLLALEEDAKKIEDPFLRRGLQLVVDGVDPAQVRQILEIEIHQMHERHQHGVGFFAAAGGYAPTMGIIGTVMELIILMQELDNPSKLGRGIAAAFLATWWGLAAANFIFLPIGNNLKTKDEEEVAFRKMLIEGVLALQAGENPRVVKEKLGGFLPPAVREAHEGAGAKAEAGA
jgi:chemotaxis protein MotA